MTNIALTEFLQGKLDDYVADNFVRIFGTEELPLVFKFIDRPQDKKTNTSTSPVLTYVQRTLASEPAAMGFPPLYQTQTEIRIECDYANHAQEQEASEKVYKFADNLLSWCRGITWATRLMPLYLISSRLEQATYNTDSRVRYLSVVILNFRFYSRAEKVSA